MLMSGIADEAGKDLATQIRAHKDLGWKYIEIRTVDGKQFSELSDADFEQLKSDIEAGGLQVSAIGSQIANWATKISDPFEPAMEILNICIPRMKALGTKYLRVMSWPNDGLDEDAWREESVRRMKLLAARAEEEGIILGLENCDGYASVSGDHYVRFLEDVGSSAIKALYDTGNPAGHGQDTWEWYLKAKPFIGYVHIKAREGVADDAAWCYPDAEGVSKVAETIADLRASGYDGFISIEPHLMAIIHLAQGIDDADKAFQVYCEYGKRATKIVETALATVAP